MGGILEDMFKAFSMGLKNYTDNMPLPTKFQERMRSKLNSDFLSKKAIMQNVTGREDMVKKFILDLYGNDLVEFKCDKVGVYLSANYDEYKKHFIKFWRQALDISRDNIGELNDIFDEELVAFEKCKDYEWAVVFENGMTISADDLLDAVYEVLSEF